MNEVGQLLSNVSSNVFYDGNGLGFSFLGQKIKRNPLTIPALFSGVELISNSLAEIPILVKKKEENRQDILEDHAVYHLFDDALMSKYMTIKMMIWDMLLYGDGLAYIERDPIGNPKTLIYIQHGFYNIDYNQQKNELYYRIPSITSGRIEPINVIHFVKDSDDGIHGKGLLEFAKDTIDLVIQTEKACKDYFMNGGTAIKGILSTTSPRLTDVQRSSIRTSWRQAYGEGGSGIAVLENGMNYQPLSNTSKDSQLLETRLYNLQEIARFLNINPTLLGDLSKSSYSTLESAQLEFVCHTLFPYISMIEHEMSRKLIKKSEARTYIDLDENYLLRSDKSSMSNYIKTLKDSGVLTINESRRMLGLNPIEGGDKLMVNFTKIEDNTIGEQEK